MKKYLSTILISFIVFVNLFTPIVGFKIALAGNEEININLTPKSSGDLGVSIDGLFKTDDKVGSISVAYFVSKNSNDLENNGVSMGGNGLDEIKKYFTSNTEGKTIYNYEIHKQVTQYSQNPNYYDFVKGDTYFMKVMVFKPTTGGVDVKYSSKVFEFKAGEQSSVVIAANQNSQTQTNTNKTQTTTNNCTITSASWNPWGEQGDDFYKDKTTTANILVKSKNCVGVAGVKLTITEEDKLVSILSDQLDNSGLYKKPISIPSDNFAVNIQLGEEDCDSGIGYDCNLYFKFEKDGEEIFNSSKNNNGRLYYECDLACLTNAKFLGIINQGSEDQPVDVALKVGMTENRTRYNFLAPIGKIVCMDWGENADGKCLGNNIGDYLNFIFKIGIGVSAALAVIMIIIAGITYMGDESVFGKTEAKSKMFSAIGGLIIAIGAWALLNTINPDLTGSNGLGVDGVNIKLTSGGGYYGVTIGSSGGANANKNVTEYDTHLKNASQKYGLECTLIKAFMYAESGGVNGLTSPSPANAKGLIQLIDTTFKEQNVGTNPMDPQTNINAGASYLSKLKNNGCNGKKQSSVCDISNIQYLAASYNGGPGANKESSDCKNSTIWQCQNNKGYAQTRIYAPRVEANYNKLKEKGWGC